MIRANLDNIPDEYKPLVKEEMTRDEVALLGTVIIRDKIARLKNKMFGWYYERKKRVKR